MIEFDDRDLRDLQEVDGVVLQDVHGQRVAIGKGFDYGNIFAFMSDYFDEYGADDFAKETGYKDDIHMFKSWFAGIPFDESEFMSVYIDKYGADKFAKIVGYGDAAEMFKSWLSSIPFYVSNLADWIYDAFDGIHAYSLQDNYDHENEAYLEAEDHKLDQARGK